MPTSAIFISAKYSAVTISNELNLDPRCPEPARFTVAKALARHISDNNCSLAYLSIFAARTRLNSFSGQSKRQNRSCGTCTSGSKCHRKNKEIVENVIRETTQSDPFLNENPPEVEWFGWRAESWYQDPDNPFIRTVLGNIESVCNKKLRCQEQPPVWIPVFHLISVFPP